MEMLKERIRSEGHVLNSDVLKVDSFLNHQATLSRAKRKNMYSL